MCSWFKLDFLTVPNWAHWVNTGMICSMPFFVTLFITLFGRGFPQKAIKTGVSH